ncbi:MAG: hypothetical protein ACLRWQ_13320 [Flavonifractor plautii]
MGKLTKKNEVFCERAYLIDLNARPRPQIRAGYSVESAGSIEVDC